MTCAACPEALCDCHDLVCAGLIPFPTSPSLVAPAGDCPTVSTGHPRNDHATPCVVPEPHHSPRISGSGFRLSPFDHGDTYVRN